MRTWLAVVAGGLGLLAFLAWKALPEPLMVQVTPARRGRVEETVSSTRAGTLKARIQVTLSAEASGRVLELRRREGERLMKGEPICLLDPTESAARLEQAMRTLEESERQAANQKRLLESKATSAEASAQAQTRAGLDRAALQVARAQHARCSLLAPFDGVLTETFVEPGQWVVPGSRICAFMDDAELVVEAEVDEIDSARLKAGQRVHLSVDALPGKAFDGVLASISPAVSIEQEKNRTVLVKVAWTAERSAVRPGMSVGVEVVVDAVEGALFVPSPAVLERGGRKMVYAIRDGRARLREIRAGLSNWETTEVLEGLEEGEPVVLSLGLSGLEDGVRASPAPP